MKLNIITAQSVYPESHTISDSSQLYKFIDEGSFRDGIKSFENPMPTIIRDNENKLICVFTYCESDN